MSLTNYLLFLIAIISMLIKETHSECNDVRIRRNFLSIGRSEWDEYVRVFREMYQQGLFEQLADIHSSNFREIHDYPQFLIWHRYFIYDFENKMRSINSNLTLPYWDAASDFDAPHRAAVFSSSAFGGNGYPEDDYCVTDGFMNDLTIHYPSNHCLRRNFQGPSPGTIYPWHSPAFITSLIQTSSNYDEFRQTLEHSLHNSIHFSVGGTFGDFSKHFSPVDALFFLHHANIDRIYAKWQISHSHALDAIDGYQIDKRGSLTRISSDYKIDHYDISVGDLLRIFDEPLCYSYDDIIEERPDFTRSVENRIRKLPRRVLRKYFPKFFAGEESDDDHDFSDMRSLTSTFNRPLPVPLALPKEFFERMGFNVSRGMAVQSRVQKFVRDMNRGLFV